MPENGRIAELGTTLANIVFRRYMVKCVAGTAVCYGIAKAVPQYPIYWSIVSLLLVLDQDEAESMRLALDRMKANIAGASVGLAALFLGAPNILSVCLSVVGTILLCEALKLGKASRSALAALIIVMMSGNARWATAVERMACVILGCLVAIALTWAFRVEGRRRVRESRQDP